MDSYIFTQITHSNTHACSIIESCNKEVAYYRIAGIFLADFNFVV